MSTFSTILASVPPSYPLCIALLSSFGIASTASLRNWVALSHLPEPPAFEDKEAEQSFIRRKRCHLAVAVLGLLGLEAYLIYTDKTLGMEALFTALTAGIINGTLVGTLIKLVGFRWSVHRLQTGYAHYSLHGLSRSHVAGLFVLLVASGGISFLAIARENPVAKCVALGAVLISMSSNGPAKVASIRKMTIYLLAYEAFLIALGVGTVYFAAQEASSNEDVRKELEQDAAEQSPALNKMLGYLIPAVYAAPIGHYIGILLRFDYAQSLTSTTSPASLPLLESVPALNFRSGVPTSTGLIVPSAGLSSLLSFRQRPYFHLCMFISILTYGVFVPLFQSAMQASLGLAGAEWASFAEKVHFYDQTYTILAFFLAVPLLAISVGIMASVRGEKKALWTYTEEWVKKTKVEEQGAIVLSPEDAEQGMGKAEYADEKPLIVVTEPEDEGAKEELVTWQEVVKVQP